MPYNNPVYDTTANSSMTIKEGNDRANENFAEINNDITILDSVGTMSTQNADGVVLSADATINSLTVGRGGGGSSTNTAVGVNALDNNTGGDRNTALGRSALRDNTSGSVNTAIGHPALQSNTTGSANTAVGREALQNNTSGTNNTGIGRQALASNTVGLENTAVGQAALFASSTGNNNIGIGREAGRGTSPFSVTTESNRIVIGNNDHTDAYIKVSWTVTSDARDKAEINPIPLGLDFVNQLQPTEYQFKAGGRDGDPDGRRRYGFLAQDVLAAEGADSVIVDDEDEENLKLHESYLVPVLVNAIKELTARIEELEKS